MGTHSVAYLNKTHTMNTNFDEQMMSGNACGKRGRWNSSSPCRKTDSPNTIRVPMMRFSADQVKLNMNSKGLITITASKEETNDTKRNGQRKVTTMVEETCQLPGYVVDAGLLEKVESKFEHGHLVISYPEDPKVVEENEKTRKANDPVQIPIHIEEDKMD